MIAITGATGMLGSYILRKFIQEQVPVIALRRSTSKSDLVKDIPSVIWREANLLDPISMMEALEGATTVIHVGALVSFDPRKKKEIMETNITGTRHVVDTCLALGIPRLIHISSVAALGRQKGFDEIDETSKWVAGSLNTHYGESKYLAELEVWRGYEEGISSVILNPSVILEGGSDRSTSRIFEFVWRERKIYAEGLINYVDIRDVVELTWRMYLQRVEGERYIVNGGCVSIKDLLTRIALQFGKKAPSICVPQSWLPTIAYIEEVRSLISGKEPLISRQSIKSSYENFLYLNTKVSNHLNFSFKGLDESIAWCCQEFRQTYTINK